ncbi:MAG TPA: ribbon-helix-helix protein, CopG family, partial [Gammaproteobacteria bacterium]|nr:ribbon-helix-helix protein, CopG family [Gammaproteobacteria bacterium]
MYTINYMPPQENLMTHSVSVRLDDKTLNLLDKMTHIEDRSRSWLMAQAIKDYVANQMWQIEAIAQAVNKMDEGESKFVDHKQVEAWIDSW